MKPTGRRIAWPGIATAAAGGLRPYLGALGLMAGALAVQLALHRLGPDVQPPYHIVLLVAVVLAGIHCGTAPAAVAALLGAAVLAVAVDQPFVAWPPNAAQIGLVILLPACALVLLATHALRHAVAASAAAEARLAEVFRQIPGAAAIIEAPDGALLLRSTKSGEVLGHVALAARREQGLAAYHGVHADGRPYLAGDYPIARALRHGEVVSAEPLRYVHADGRIADLEVHAGPVRDNDGVIVAAVGMAFDVSARVESERALRALSERLRTALDVGALGTWEIDLATGESRWDAQMAAMFDLPRAAVTLARDEVRAFFAPAELARAQAAFALALDGDGVVADELAITTAQGEPRWLVSRGVVLRESGRVIAVVRDDTERHRREQALQEAVAARELLLREADHRIKNSLQLVASLLSLQRSRVDHPAAAAALESAIARVNAVADAHLALQQSPDLRMIEVQPMLAGLCQRLAALNPMVAIECAAPPGILLEAENAIPLGMIVSELVTNALRHAYPPGEAGMVKVTATPCEGQLAVLVADHGCGLPPQVARRGLGSTIVQSFASRIGAGIDTQSRPGGGVAIRLTMALPAPEAVAVR